MFPVIANFYGVTTDELLGVDVSKTNEMINKICAKVDNLFNEDKFPEALTILRNAVIDYPAKDELQYRLAMALTGNIREYPDYLDEAINIYLKILETSDNIKLRSRVTRDLMYRYYTKNDIVTAKIFVEQLPSFHVCYEYTLGRSNLLKGQELADYLKSNITLFGNAILECLEYFTNYNPLIMTKEQMAPETIESAKQKVEYMKKVLE